ncbi:MAG TPA: 6-pyruvoyl-tetrahydropterin synthase-related protein, partial [Vicinamibacteria bacterium]
MAVPTPPETAPRVRRAADLAGLLAILLVLLDYLRPALLLLPTHTAGGDTPCHVPTFAYFHQHLLPQWRLHGWDPGGYLGHPVLLYYFPLPFLVMSALVPAFGIPVAFKLGTALGVFLFPLFAYAAFRLMGFRFPGPLLGAAGAFLFLMLEENPIWGGTLASTLTGEFSYTYGIGLALLFLGFCYRAYARGRPPGLTAALLALTALAHGYAVIWAGLSVSYFLYRSRQPRRTLTWLAWVAGLSFALAAVWLLPLLSGWGWTTPYDDAWITISWRNLVPLLLWPLFIPALLGLVATLALQRRLGGVDHRLLFLWHAALVGVALTMAGPALGIIDVRFMPFAQLALALAGAAALGLALEHARARTLLALGLTATLLAVGDGSSRFLRYWIDWNYAGLEAKDGWSAWRELTTRLHGTVADPRVAIEYHADHEKAGSIRMYETFPYWSGRSTLEGVYNQASLMTHPVYFLASELGASSPNPFRSREYSTFDTESALRHLRLLHVNEVVALSQKLRDSLDQRPEARLLFRVPPYSAYGLADPGPGYVEPMAFAPVRSPLAGWRDKAYRWFTRKPLSPVHLVFTDDPRFPLVEPDPWLPPPAQPLPGGVSVREVMGLESLEITTNRPGHPLLVKISYHPRWRAEGAAGPYLVSPALMMIVPERETVRLYYGRNRADDLGLLLTSATALGLLGLGAWRRWGRRAAAPAPPVKIPANFDACEMPRPARRWGGVIPGTLLVLLAVARFLPARTPAGPRADG